MGWNVRRTKVRRTGAKEVRPEDASQSASMKSSVAPKVVWRSRGDDGGDMSAVASPATTMPGCPPVHTQPQRVNRLLTFSFQDQRQILQVASLAGYQHVQASAIRRLRTTGGSCRQKELRGDVNGSSPHPQRQAGCSQGGWTLPRSRPGPSAACAAGPH